MVLTGQRLVYNKFIDQKWRKLPPSRLIQIHTTSTSPKMREICSFELFERICQCPKSTWRVRSISPIDARHMQTSRADMRIYSSDILQPFMKSRVQSQFGYFLLETQGHREALKAVRKVVNSSSITVVKTKQTQPSCEKAVRQQQQKMVAKSRDTAKEQSLFASSSKNKVLTKEAGIAYLYKIGERG